MPLGKKGNAQQDFDELKRKYLTVDRNYEALKTLTRNALLQFDELKKKSKDDNILLEKEKAAHESVAKELIDIQAEYEKLKETSAKAFDQYGEMVGRYEKQLELKEKAEAMATDLARENKVLQRNVESMTQFGDTENKKLLVQLEEITRENSTLKQEVDDLKESIEYLKKKYGDKEQRHQTLVRQLSHATEKVAEMEKEKEDNVFVDKDSFERLQKASEMALNEIKSLSEKLEAEQALRREAEHIAHQHMTEAEALKRQSAIVLSSLEEQQQLAEALAEVENLSSKMSDMKKESEDKITDLESQIEILKESTLLEENKKLEEKLSLVTAEAESVAANSQTTQQKGEVTSPTVKPPPYLLCLYAGEKEAISS